MSPEQTPTAPTLAALADDLEAGRTSARALAEACLARIEDPDGEGARTFVRVDRGAVLRAADAMDALRAAGAAPSRFAGIPISVKDLFDVRGQVTAAGSRVLADAPPAAEDAPAVARVRRAGFVLIGRTNMTEFAYSGLGLNPHHGTPLAPWDRATGRIPGGSSSGAAVSVADGMAHGALGTDTGGSCRIPAAFCGIVGYKPTARRVPLAGVVPLAPSLDSVGPLARSVACCAILDAVLAGEPPEAPEPRAVEGLRLLVPENLVLDDVEAEVATRHEAALARLARAGARIVRAVVPELEEVAAINRRGGFTGPESFAWHRDLLAARGAAYDPRVAGRIAHGERVLAADYVAARAMRDALVRRVAARLAPHDALAMPTTPLVPPRLADLADDAVYGRTNLTVLRNPTLINMIDGCAISLPLPGSSEAAPVGLMLAAAGGADRRLFAVAAGVERLLGDR